MKVYQSTNGTNSKKPVNIRRAKLSDLDQLVDLHYVCFEPDEHLAMRFGKSFIRAAYKWFITSEETFAILAEVENEVVGLTTVCDSPYNGPMLRNCLREAIVGLLTHPWLIFHAEIFNRIIDLFIKKQDVGELTEDQSDVAHLAFIAAHPDCRGRGIGSMLLNESKQIALKRGKRFHRAGVYKVNIASQRMFKKCGHVKVPSLETKRTVFMQAELKE